MASICDLDKLLVVAVVLITLSLASAHPPYQGLKFKPSNPTDRWPHHEEQGAEQEDSASHLSAAFGQRLSSVRRQQALSSLNNSTDGAAQASSPSIEASTRLISVAHQLRSKDKILGEIKKKMAEDESSPLKLIRSRLHRVRPQQNSSSSKVAQTQSNSTTVVLLEDPAGSTTTTTTSTTPVSVQPEVTEYLQGAESLLKQHVGHSNVTRIADSKKNESAPNDLVTAPVNETLVLPTTMTTTTPSEIGPAPSSAEIWTPMTFSESSPALSSADIWTPTTPWPVTTETSKPLWRIRMENSRRSSNVKSSQLSTLSDVPVTLSPTPATPLTPSSVLVEISEPKLDSPQPPPPPSSSSDQVETWTVNDDDASAPVTMAVELDLPTTTESIVRDSFLPSQVIDRLEGSIVDIGTTSGDVNVWKSTTRLNHAPSQPSRKPSPVTTDLTDALQSINSTASETSENAAAAATTSTTLAVSPASTRSVMNNATIVTIQIISTPVVELNSDSSNADVVKEETSIRPSEIESPPSLPSPSPPTSTTTKKSLTVYSLEDILQRLVPATDSNPFLISVPPGRLSSPLKTLEDAGQVQEPADKMDRVNNTTGWSNSNESKSTTSIYIIGIVAIIPLTGALLWIARLHFQKRRQRLNESETSSESGFRKSRLPLPNASPSKNGRILYGVS